jgi:hypothetical protein
LQSDEKYKDFSKWFCCNGRPAQVKNTKILQRFFKVVKNTEIFQSGPILMGDLPRWKTWRFFKVVKNAKIFQSDLVVMNDLPRWKVLKVVRNARISQNGFIIMGNRPKWKNFEGGEKCKDFSKCFHCNGQPA